MSSLPNLSSRFKDGEWLRLKKRPSLLSETTITSVDLFAGCGGLVVGMMEACRRLGLDHSVVFANEWDEEALSVFVQNLNPVESNDDDIAELFDGELGSEKLTENEEKLLRNNPLKRTRYSHRRTSLPRSF